MFKVHETPGNYLSNTEQLMYSWVMSPMACCYLEPSQARSDALKFAKFAWSRSLYLVTLFFLIREPRFFCTATLKAGGVLTASLGGLWSAVTFYEDHSDVDMTNEGSTYRKVGDA
jgi:hypothetical protein